MRTSVQNGTDDDSHNDEIELTKCLNKLDKKNCHYMKEKTEKMSLRSKIVSNPKGIKLNPKRCGHLGGVFLEK